MPGGFFAYNCIEKEEQLERDCYSCFYKYTKLKTKSQSLSPEVQSNVQPSRIPDIPQLPLY